MAFLENLAEWEGNRARLDARRGYLIDERGELVIVVAVDKDDLEARVAEFVAEAEAAESAADDDDALSVAVWEVEAHIVAIFSFLFGACRSVCPAFRAG